MQNTDWNVDLEFESILYDPASGISAEDSGLIITGSLENVQLKGRSNTTVEIPTSMSYSVTSPEAALTDSNFVALSSLCGSRRLLTMDFVIRTKVEFFSVNPTLTGTSVFSCPVGQIEYVEALAGLISAPDIIVRAPPLSGDTTTVEADNSSFQ